MHENWTSIDAGSESSNELLDEGWELDHEGMRRQSLRKLSVELYHIGSDLKAENGPELSIVDTFEPDPFEAKPPASPIRPFFYLQPKREKPIVQQKQHSKSVLPTASPTDPTTRRIGAYSPESRKKRIQRFHLKRKSRVWHKKVKYDCRKTLAQFRPRYKGRFVKVNAT